VRYLQGQARKVLQDARLNSMIHAISCNFKKTPGTVYYVYKQRTNHQQEFMSIIPPQVLTDSVLKGLCEIRDVVRISIHQSNDDFLSARLPYAALDKKKTSGKN
jgi:hypothetical protein